MKLEELLNQKGLVLQSPSEKEILVRARESSPTKLFYGETYDHFGNTIDSMKYYFFVADLAKSFKEEGFDVEPVILIADTAACRNVAPELESKYLRLGEARVEFVKKINEVYGTELGVVKMSDYIDSLEFIEKRGRIIEICKKDSELMKLVEKSVPESKVEIEREKGFMYSFDEIATIIDLDIKVGPPREDLYDNIAREIAERHGDKKLMSLFLTPTFPLGKNWAYFFGFEGIEDHGITAYKAGSKRLQDHRIIVGRTNIEYAKELIDASFCPTDPILPNAVLDIGIIAEMAKKRLEKDNSPITLAEEFYSGKISPERLKEMVLSKLEAYIISRF